MENKSFRSYASDLEISPSYLSMILSGQRKPSVKLQNKLRSIGLCMSFTNKAKSGAHNPKVVGSNPTPATNPLLFASPPKFQITIIKHQTNTNF